MTYFKGGSIGLATTSGSKTQGNAGDTFSKMLRRIMLNRRSLKVVYRLGYLSGYAKAWLGR